MARVPKAAAVSMLVGGVIFAAFGFWWFYPALPQIEPPQLPGDSQISKADRDSWNKEVLGSFKEIPMRSASFPDQESYRLVLMPTFDPPILVRASRTAQGFELTTKRLDGMGGYEIGKLSSNDKRPLTEPEWQHLVELLDDASFWSMPTIDRTDEPVPDGAWWLIESRRQDIFHDVARITPKPKFLVACRYFLQLAGRESDYKGYWQPID